MSNTNLTPDMVTQRAMMILHNNVIFSKNVNRQYSDEFAKSGAKIGTTLRIRKPVQWTINSGAALNVQDITEESTILTIDSQKHFDFQFGASELTLTIDDFSERYLKTGCARLASQMDYDGMTKVLDLYNQVGVPGTPLATSTYYLTGGATLDNFAAPRDGKRVAIINPDSLADSVDGLKGLFVPNEKLSKQYTNAAFDGMTLGYKLIGATQNVNMVTLGTRVNTASTYTYSTSTTNTITLTSSGAESGKTWVVGDKISFATCRSVNPETKQIGQVQKFVVTAAATNNGSGTVTLSVSPNIVTTAGPTQTVSATPSGVAVVYGAASTVQAFNVAFHEDCFTLGTADLVMPNGVDFASRQVYDGFNMRIVRQYDINNDNIPCRVDVLYGWLTQRKELGCVLAG